MRKLRYAALGAALIVAASATNALASVVSAAAPEINPSTMTAGLALLAGGVLLARARFRK
jgi:hypothetical protein